MNGLISKQCIRVSYPKKTIFNSTGGLILIVEPDCNYISKYPVLIQLCSGKNIMGIFKSQSSNYIVIDTVEPGKWNLHSDDRELQINTADIDTICCVREMIFT